MFSFRIVDSLPVSRRETDGPGLRGSKYRNNRLVAAIDEAVLRPVEHKLGLGRRDRAATGFHPWLHTLSPIHHIS